MPNRDKKANTYGSYRVEMYLVDPDTGQRQRIKRPLERVRQRCDRPWMILTPAWARWHEALRKLDRRTGREHI